MKIPFLFLTVILLWSSTTSTFANEGKTSPSDSPFCTELTLQKGKWEATVNSGAMFSPFVATENRPTVDYTMTALQIGYVLNEPAGPSLLRGNVEVGPVVARAPARGRECRQGQRREKFAAAQTTTRGRRTHGVIRSGRTVPAHSRRDWLEGQPPQRERTQLVRYRPLAYGAPASR